MERTITIVGTGMLSTKPDYIHINMIMEAYDKEYGLALKKGKKQLSAISEVLSALDYDPNDLQTLDFAVSTDYIRNADNQGRFKNEFKDYICRYKLRLGLDFDMKRCEDTLNALQKLIINPRTSIDFTVKNPRALDEQLVKLTMEDAMNKCRLLSESAHIKVGKILSIEYNNKPMEYLSTTSYVPTLNYKTPSKKHFHPASINIEDFVTVVWQIID